MVRCRKGLRIMGSHVCKHSEIISQETRSTISLRYHTVTKTVNRVFWNSQSETQHSLYVGSYGRGTAINTSDLDILVELPKSEYDRYDVMTGNGQSRLLQALRNSILSTYPRSDVRADGQVVKISFFDGMKFEILPAFKRGDFFDQWDGTFYYPDTNMGGNWRSTNPKAEQNAMKEKNSNSDGLFYDTCKHIRSVRDNQFSSYHLSGIVIDSFVYLAMGNWRWLSKGETSTSVKGDYERVLLNYLIENSIAPLTAPGSGKNVDVDSSLECLKKVLVYMAE